MMEDVPRCGKCGRYPIDHHAGKCIYPADPAVYRAALELVREGLDLPHAKTAGDDAKRMEILFLRVIDLQIMVGAILDMNHGHRFTLGYCREQLAKHAAAGYHPIGVPIAYGQYDECAAGGCGHRKGSHWEHAEPGGPRTGCGYLGCPCTAYAPPPSPETGSSVMSSEHSTYMGDRGIRRADGTDAAMPFARCRCGWEGPGRLKRSEAVQDGTEHLQSLAQESGATP